MDEMAEAKRIAALEIRPDSDGEFDEIVARFADGMVHVETMSDKSCYVGFYWNDGRQLQWYISSKKPLRYHHEESVHVRGALLADPFSTGERGE